MSGQIGGGVVGPALGGVAFGAAPVLPFAVNAASYLMSSLFIGSFAWRSDTRPARPQGTADRGRGSFHRDLVAGLVFVQGNRAARTTLILSASAGLFGWMPEATLVLFARQDLGLSAAGVGLLLGVTTLGAVLGGLLAGPAARRTSTPRLLTITYLSYGILLIPVAFLTSAWLVGAVFLLQGLPLIVSNAAIRSIQQSVVPGELLGRFGAVNRIVNGAVIPLSLAAGGLLGQWLGLRPVWAIAGLGFVIVFLLNTRALKSLQGRDRPPAAPMGPTAE